ncbi:hypothetical protein BSG1_02455 [Bacillus sp. SG-1]|nr:hypothetical protein BSG1_02455 [Bacillus sp. SG-1]
MKSANSTYKLLSLIISEQFVLLNFRNITPHLKIYTQSFFNKNLSNEYVLIEAEGAGPPAGLAWRLVPAPEVTYPLERNPAPRGQITLRE